MSIYSPALHPCSLSFAVESVGAASQRGYVESSPFALSYVAGAFRVRMQVNLEPFIDVQVNTLLAAAALALGLLFAQV